MAEIDPDVISKTAEAFRWAHRTFLELYPDYSPFSNYIPPGIFQNQEGGISIFSDYIVKTPMEAKLLSSHPVDNGIVGITTTAIARINLEIVHTPNELSFGHCDILGMPEKPKSKKKTAQRALSKISRWMLRP